MHRKWRAKLVGGIKRQRIKKDGRDKRESAAKEITGDPAGNVITRSRVRSTVSNALEMSITAAMLMTNGKTAVVIERSWRNRNEVLQRGGGGGDVPGF